MFPKTIFIGILVMVTPQLVFAGTAYIPFWQHGYGITFFSNIINNDTKTVRADIYLYDIYTSTTYAAGDLVAPGESYMVDTGWWGGPLPVPGFAFGWGWIESTGEPGTT